MIKGQLIYIVVVLGILTGFYVGHFWAAENLNISFTCNDIRHFHAQLLLRQGFEFNVSEENPRRDANQAAADLNHLLWRVCRAHPYPNREIKLNELMKE
jgi:hypothetical protein